MRNGYRAKDFVVPRIDPGVLHALVEWDHVRAFTSYICSISW